MATTIYQQYVEERIAYLHNNAIIPNDDQDRSLDFLMSIFLKLTDF